MDEDYSNYEYLHNWLVSFIDGNSWRNLVKDMKLHVLSGNKTPLVLYTFHYAFPVSLGEISYDSSNTDTTPIIFNVEFRYQWFDFERVSAK